MTRQYKNIMIWLAFGVFLGLKMAEVLRDIGAAGTLDWILVIGGVIVAIIHYLPDKQ